MTVLNELHQDHIKLNKMLAILRLKVEKLRAGNHPNFMLMAEVVDYIAHYADVCQHPREDTMFRHFQGRSEELDRVLGRCVKAQKHMTETCHELSGMIEGILNDAEVIPMNEFTDKLEAFIEEQFEHLSLEEGALLPVLQGVATETDWETLSAELPRFHDPLADKTQAERYRELYRELVVDIAV